MKKKSSRGGQDDFEQLNSRTFRTNWHQITRSRLVFKNLPRPWKRENIFQKLSRTCGQPVVNIISSRPL